MLLRGYAVITGALIGGYLLWPSDLRILPFLMVTLVTVPAVVVGLRRAPRGVRGPWWLQLIALGSYNAGNIWWILNAALNNSDTGDGAITGVLFAAADVLVLASAIVVVFQRGRGDVGGVIDSVVTAVALGGLLWDVVLLPAMRDHHSSLIGQSTQFVNVFVLTGALGALIRVSLVGSGRIGAVRLLTIGVAFALAGNVVGVLFIDPVTGVRPDWIYMVYLVAYAALGCAALHPSVASVTTPGTAPDDHLSGARLAFLGLMLAIAPLVGGGRVMFGLPADGVLIAISSAGLIPLVMIRIGRLSKARREAEQALHRLATSDNLTGLPNRSACLNHVTEELAIGPDGLSALFCDLDGFKPVNDLLGHAAGDELLVAVAERMRGCLREGDMVSRLGGDEFVIICRGTDAVEEISDRLRTVVAEPFEAAGEQVRIGISIGVANAIAGDSTDDLVGRADLAMYVAKRDKTVGVVSLAYA